MESYLMKVPHEFPSGGKRRFLHLLFWTLLNLIRLCQSRNTWPPIYGRERN